MRLKMKFKRMQRGLSQKQLAEKVGLHYQSISDFERGKSNPSYENMKKISEILETSVDELFFNDEI